MFRTSLIASLTALTIIQPAFGFVCGQGVYREGCVGPNGAVVGPRPLAPAPVAGAVVVGPNGGVGVRGGVPGVGGVGVVVGPNGGVGVRGGVPGVGGAVV